MRHYDIVETTVALRIVIKLNSVRAAELTSVASVSFAVVAVLLQFRDFNLVVVGRRMRPALSGAAKVDGAAANLNSPARYHVDIVFIDLLTVAPEINRKVVAVPAILTDFVAKGGGSRSYQKNPSLRSSEDVVVVH